MQIGTQKLHPLFVTYLLFKQPREYERRHDGSIRFDDELWCIDIQFAPGYLFVRHRARVRSVRGGTIADLAEIAPERDVVQLHILVKHRYNAYREIAGYTATDLEEPYPLTSAVLRVPTS